MPSETEISFILPVYNVAPYLEQCLKSLIMQSVNKEIIIVNDGSTDESLAIAEHYAQRYTYIKIINQINSGVSAARNCGLKNACGKHILFVDPDDYLCEDVIGQLCRFCSANSLDMLQFRFIDFYEQRGEFVPRPMQQLLVRAEQIYTAEDYFCKIRRQRNFDAMVWLRIYNRDFVLRNDLLFAEKLVFEDILYTLQSLTIEPSARISEVDRAFYVYRRREHSIMSSYSKTEYINASFLIHKKMLEYVSAHSFSQSLQLTIYKYIYGYIIRIISASKDLPKNELATIYKLLTSDILKNTLRYRANLKDYTRISKFWLEKYLFLICNRCKETLKLCCLQNEPNNDKDRKNSK